MYIFNPDSDLALANFNANFTAPASACKMRHDLALLPLWYATCNSSIIAEGELNKRLLKELKSILPISSSLISFSQLSDYSDSKVKPWGWNPALIKQLVQSGINEQMLPSMFDVELLRSYSGRQNAMKLLSDLKALNSSFCGESFYYTNIDQLLVYLYNVNSSQVLKMPYSGSGKGLVWTKGEITDKQIDWCKRVINMQGGIVVEPVLNKVQDFAMEFEMTNTGIQFIGYSLFSSAPSGAYIGNVLLSDSDIEDRLSVYIERGLLKKLQSILKRKLIEYFPHYRGCLGVDMMVCKTDESSYQLQPCVEVNMRMNMGIVAHRICESFIHPNSTGVFSINYFKQDGEAQNHALTMQSKNPLIIEHDRIKSGYLALTPFDRDTRYVANILIKQNHEEN